MYARNHVGSKLQDSQLQGAMDQAKTEAKAEAHFQRDVPPNESPSATTSTGQAEQAWSTIATDGGGILQEEVDAGRMQWSQAHDAYYCMLCDVWCNGHKQAIRHLLSNQHDRYSALGGRSGSTTATRSQSGSARQGAIP